MVQKAIFLDEEARQFGLKCLDCGTKKVIYFISKPFGQVYPAGAYCYKCLLTRAKNSRRVYGGFIIPFPIAEDTLNKLKCDLGLKINSPPFYKLKL